MAGPVEPPPPHAMPTDRPAGFAHPAALAGAPSGAETRPPEPTAVSLISDDDEFEADMD